tara:strand:- start:654 stop:1019 length:366 start_codon:yes stop_codon:yes gene_type:complete
MTTATFNIVGTSNLNGTTKVRWANDLVTRFKMLHKGGHTNIELFDLPEAMTKQAAAQWLADSDNFEKLNQDAQYAVSSKLDEYMKVKPEVKISLEEIAQRPTIDGWDVVNKGEETLEPTLS